MWMVVLILGGRSQIKKRHGWSGVDWQGNWLRSSEQNEE
jgi:hypothetical protein